MPSYPDEVRAAERREARNRKSWKPPIGIAALRVAELDREFTDRYAAMVLPDDDSARDDIEIMLHHLARRSRDPERKIPHWLDARAPWFNGAERDTLVAKVLTNPLKFRADTLAARIGLTAERRARLKIRTIGAVDQTASQRRDIRADSKRQKKQAYRRAAGSVSRADYESGSAARIKPWSIQGVSRRSWYRQRRADGSKKCPPAP